MVIISIAFSFVLYFIWNISRILISLIFTEEQQSIAFSLQEFFNSVLITFLLIFFVLYSVSREYSYFENLSLIHNGIIRTTNKPYRIQFANQPLLELLNYSEEIIKDLELDSIFCQNDKKNFENFFTDSSIRSIKDIETNLVKKDKSPTPVLVSISRFYSRFNKKEKGLFIVVNDIKKLKEAQNQLKHLMDVEKNSVLNSFIQKVGHEINNPLSFMMYDSERLIEYVREMIDMLKIYDEVELKLLKDSEKSEISDNINKIEQIKKDMNYESAIDDLQEILSATKEGIQRIAKVVKEVRTFPFQESEKYRQSLNNIVSLTVDLVRKQYLESESEINIMVKLDPNIPPIPLKAGEIAQVILNLLINSIQAIGKKGGKILLRTELLKEIEKDIDKNQLILLCVEDDGKGIKKELIQKIFDPYFTTKDEGTGLGLSIAKKIIEEHNGKIEIQSEYKKGTKIIIKLPAY